MCVGHGLRKTGSLSVGTQEARPECSERSTKAPVPALFLSSGETVSFWNLDAQEVRGGWGRKNAGLALCQMLALPGTASYLAGQGAVTKGSVAGF